MLTVETIQDFGRLQALAPQWNPLLQRSRSDGIFLTWGWISTWWQVFGARNRLLVLVAREAGELRGIAPLMIGRGPPPQSPLLRRLMFIGQGGTYPEYLDFIVEPGREQEIVRAFCATLLGEHRRRWDVLFLERVLDRSPNLAALCAAFAERGLEVELGQEIACPFIELPERFDALLKDKSAHFRKRWSYTRNRLQRDGDVSYRFAPGEVSIDEAYRTLGRLNRERFGDAGKSFRTPEYIEMHRRFCELSAPRGWLVLCLMQQGGEVIAAKYDFLYAGKLWGNQGGWSREHQQRRPGEILIGKLLEWGIARGAREYDFLGWPDEYKERWSTGRRTMREQVRAYGRTAPGRVARRLAQAKRLLQTHLPPEVLARLRRIRARLFGGAAAVEPQAEPAAKSDAE